MLPTLTHYVNPSTVHIYKCQFNREGVPSISDAYASSLASTMYNMLNIPDSGQGGDVSGPYNDVYTDQDDMFGLYSC